MAAAYSSLEISDRIARAIREKVFAPGTQLVQEDLARKFEVSRSPVREALRILSTEGLIEMAPGGGAYVRRLDRAELQELYDLRLLIEPTIVEAIVQHASAQDLAVLTELAEQMQYQEETVRWMRRNFEFHIRLYETARLPRTGDILKGLLTAVQPYSHENVALLGGRSQADSEHVAMVECIRREDADGLAALFREHIGSARTRVAESLSLEEEDPLGPLRD